MKNIVKALGLLSIFAVIPGAMAATSRVSMVAKATPRLPSIAGYITSVTGGTTSSVINGTSTTYLADVDCIDNYSACIKGNDACGSEFEECTNTILLHAKTPTCLNVLSQCSNAGRASLFGSYDLNAIATSATTDSNGEITAYTYPTASSVLGQMITAAQIENRLDTDQCVKKYTSCLHKESICGQDFELCTDPKEFKKQALSCDSTLARCQVAGKTELFGSTAAASSLQPASGSRLSEMITEGAALAVNNAVATCNKVTDQCILNACSKNPNKCIEDRPEILIRIADATNGGRAVTAQDLMEISQITTKREVANYIRQECQQTIGSNRYCYMTVKAKPVTKESVLTDPDNVSEVFDDMYNGEFGRFTALKDKINQITDKFDAKVQDKCIDTISSCAMRSCGGGIGSVCYSQSRDASTGEVNITKAPKSYKEVRSACRAIVDTDANCQYAAVLSQGSLFAGYMNDENSVFTTLYPEDSSVSADPIGVIASLNATLATSYNDAAIENMRKQCQTVALSCVKSMCGKDYESCYRNRTDVMSGTYSTGQAKFDNSMNKMGGVLDYNIVIGLCLNTVKDSSVCNEHLKIAINKLTTDTDSWGANTSVRSAWRDANSTTATLVENPDKVLIACTVSNPSDDCPAGIQEEPSDEGQCIGIMDENGCVYDTPVYQNIADYKLDNAGTSLFQELLADVEKEAQAKYNAKLTKEQGMCLAQNNGGIMGAAENGSTFMWVKLNSNKIPKNYNMKGLTTKQFKASNDLYGSFCRARITVTSDDRAIQEVLGDKATAYFAVGDAFTCGSWIDDKTLQKITEKVGEQALVDAGLKVRDSNGNLVNSSSTKSKYAWGAVAGLLGGGAIGTGLTESGVLGKWLNKSNVANGASSSAKQKKSSCINYAEMINDISINTAAESEGGDSLESAKAKLQDAKASLDSAAALCKQVLASEVSKSMCKVADVDEEPTKVETAAASLKTIKSSAKRIAASCEEADDNYVSNDTTKVARIAVPIATAVGGTVLAAGITASVIKAQEESIQNEAAQKWLQEVGEHIQCYLGAEELGSYGDVISFTIDE